MRTDLQLNAEAVKFREKFGYSNREPMDIKSVILSQDEYTLIKLPLSSNISGICIKDNGSKYIALNSNMSIGRQRFTAAHELYHLEIEKEGTGKICHMGIYDSKNDSEREADKFASYLLMPYDGLEWFVDAYQIKEWSVKHIIELSQYYQMSYLAVLFRLEMDGRITKQQHAKLTEVNIRKEAAQYGVDTTLYERTPVDEAEYTYGEYPRLLTEVQAEGLISDGLYAQYCREGFRAIDYNSDKENGVVMND